MNSIDQQTKYWDGVADAKTFTHPLDRDLLHSRLSQDAAILDFGCGYGRLCNELYTMGFRNVMGADISDKMIRRGREAFPHLKFVTLPAEEMPFEAGSFDAVLLFAVLTCIPTNEGQEGLINAMERLLRPGGILYISDYWLQSDSRNRARYDQFYNNYGIYGVFELPEGAVVRHHDTEWIESLLAGFTREALFDIRVTTMNGHESKGFQYIGRKHA